MDPTNDQQRTNDPADSDAPTDTESGKASNETEEQTSSDNPEALREEIDRLQEERDELNDRLLRKAAEFENYRRRTAREKERRHEAGKLAVIEPMLDVLDDFERSIEAARDLEDSEDPEAAYESLKGGVEMVFRKFRDELQALGVEPIEAEGEPFDEQFHEAMMRQPSEEVQAGTVLQEIRKGYTMDDRVIRHSRVVVAADPSENAHS